MNYSSITNNTSLIQLLLSDKNKPSTLLNNNNTHINNKIFCPKNTQSSIQFSIFQFILPSITTAFGVLGNFLTILTIVKSGLFKNYVNKYLIVLLASDSILLLKISVERIFKLGKRSYFVFFVGQYLWNVSIYVSNLTIILLTIERFFAVVFPMKHYKYKDFNRWKIILSIIIFSLLVNFNIILAIREKNPEEINKTDYNYYYNTDLPLAKPLVLGPRILITFIFPVFAVLLVNFTIILKLRTRDIIKNNSTISAETKTNNNVISIIPLVYVLLNFPYNLHITVIRFFHIHKFDCWITNLIFVNIFFINYGTNFMLYTLTSSQYRDIFVKLWWNGTYKKYINKIFKPNNNKKIDVESNESKTTKITNIK